MTEMNDEKKPQKKLIPNRIDMACQDPLERARNFQEVALGYTAEQAMEEANRCLLCPKPPCVGGCPVGIDIPSFIALIREGDFQGAVRKIKESNALPAVCGRVCPQEDQCEKVCVVGKKHESLAIGRLERFAADWERSQGRAEKPAMAESSGKKVAVVGGGPAGLTCAAELAVMGHDVTIFEALHAPGGVLLYGIPEFRLPKDIVDREVQFIKSMGVKIETNFVVGKTGSVDEFFDEGFHAVFLGNGAGLPRFMGIPGENYNGVYSANEYLTRANLMKAYKFPEMDTPIKAGKNVAVVGGGNVAMDAVRTALRLGAEHASIIYRRSKEEMPARHEEVEHAEEEGVEFHMLVNPVRVIGDSNGIVTGLECLRMELGEPDESGRRKPVPVEGSEYVIPADTVIIAIGTGANPIVAESASGLKTNRWGYITADEETGATNIPGVYAGGDIVTGAATVILAMGAGKKAAKAMDGYLRDLA